MAVVEYLECGADVQAADGMMLEELECFECIVQAFERRGKALNCRDQIILYSMININAKARSTSQPDDE